MSKKAQQQIVRLRQDLLRHNKLYYIDAKPELTDLEYDQLLEELHKLEQLYPEYDAPDSPTKRVGEQPVEYLVTIDHRLPMLSIDNTYNLEELRKFGQRIRDSLDGREAEWVVELKIDGVAASVIYENGVLARALTRGNGVQGDDITHNIRTIADIPLRLLGDDCPDVLEVRGEVYMTNHDLAQINERQRLRGESPFKNTRNATAGSIRQLDPRICAERKLRMFCHGIGYCEGIRSSGHMEFLDEIRGYGLPASPFVSSFPTFEEAITHCEFLTQEIQDIDFEVDGIVLKLNHFHQREALGNTAKSPRWIVAYKWERYEAITTLNNITVQVGKTGAITPVAELEPVELAGTTVSRSSLHNADEIKRKDIRIGDVVVVEKAGKIIPRVVRVEKHERKVKLPEFPFPTHCPECETAVVKDEGGVYIRCPNYQCPAQLRERVRFFATRNAMDIEGLGDKLVEQLVSSGLISGYADLYQLSIDQLSELERMGELSSKNVVENIQASKTRGLAKVLNALSIRHVGAQVAATIAEHFQTLERLRKASVEQLSEINEIGGIIAESLYRFVNESPGKEILEQLEIAGVEMIQQDSGNAQQSDLFAGKTFVVTGTLVNYTRNQIHDLIVQHGGKTSTSISGKTDYLVAGENAGSKLAKAQQLGVQVLSEEGFEQLVSTENQQPGGPENLLF
ncbi:MAG: NAD-dependent DNA ligase LigA [Planctomycetaceae bacterium]